MSMLWSNECFCNNKNILEGLRKDLCVLKTFFGSMQYTVVNKAFAFSTWWCLDVENALFMNKHFKAFIVKYGSAV